MQATDPHQTLALVELTRISILSNPQTKETNYLNMAKAHMIGESTQINTQTHKPRSVLLFLELCILSSQQADVFIKHKLSTASLLRHV